MTFIEANRSSILWFTLPLSSMGTALSVASMKLLVLLFSHMFFTRLKMSFMTVDARPLMVKRNVRQVVAKGATRKVIALDDHSLRKRRVLACLREML